MGIMLGDGRKHLACVITWAGSHVIMFSVGRFMCKERVMLIEREIRLLFCVNKRCFVTDKHVMRQSSMASPETFTRLS